MAWPTAPRVGEALLAVALQHDLGELRPRRRRPRPGRRDARLRARDCDALVARVELEEDLPLP